MNEPDETLDPELQSLPSPPRGRRLAHVAVLAVVIVLAAILGVRLVPDVAYYFSPGTPVDLGRAGAIDRAGLEPNRYARVVGLPEVGTALRFRRFIRSGVYRVFPLAGDDRLLVQVYVPPERLDRGLPSVEFAGRLLPLERAPAGYGAVVRYLDDTLDHRVAAGAYVLLSGERPSDLWWAPLAFAVLVLFVLTNLLVLVGALRRIPVREARTHAVEAGGT